MASITIKDFSCINDATLSLSNINVLIGPQGSGKSVTTKLIYFFSDIVGSFSQYAEEGSSFTEYKAAVEKSFAVWFPPQAWGGKRFLITYVSGNFSVRVLRRKISGQLSDQVSVKFSDWFQELYEFALAAYGESESGIGIPAEPEDVSAHSIVDRSFRIRHAIQRRLSRSIEGDHFYQQTFIPAGRAFFTSIGRLVAGIEHAGSLDPVTLKFARLFASWRDQGSSPRFGARLNEDDNQRRDNIMLLLFGGRVLSKRENEYIEMLDGRRVPFSALSSGQQELLPIWFFLQYLIWLDSIRRAGSSRNPPPDRHLVYLEEPEAHLFPTAQGALMDVLVSTVVPPRSGRRLIITTHSPYIMSKLNVYLKAGQLSRRRRPPKELSEIVDRRNWIRREQISAFRIEGGELHSIIDEEEGLIDARYLDSISDQISDDFLRLLELESEAQ